MEAWSTSSVCVRYSSILMQLLQLGCSVFWYFRSAMRAGDTLLVKSLQGRVVLQVFARNGCTQWIRQNSELTLIPAHCAVFGSTMTLFDFL